MNNNVSDIEADALLNELVDLREKCKTSNSKVLLLKYKKITALCAKKFDYIVVNRVRRYKAFSNYDDLLQDGRLALMLALNSYELGKGSWFWWANQYVKTKISREANRHSTIKIPIKQTKNMLPYKVTQIPTIIDPDFSALESIEDNETRTMVRNAISKLPTTQRRVIELHYEMSGKNGSIASICEELKLSRKDCIKLIDDAKIILKKHLEQFT